MATLRPFPQNLDFQNCIKPALNQNQLNNDVTSFYNYWKNKYLKRSAINPTRYYIKADSTGGSHSAITNSEAMGYGMIITALMAGYDPNAKTYFDGLYEMVRTHPSVNNPLLMQWQIMPNEASQNIGSATDGDEDIAYALLLAHYQWGSAGSVNYLAKAKDMITNGLKKSYITSAMRLAMYDGNTDIYSTRPSDWMFDHYRAFRFHTSDAVWDALATSLYNTYKSIINKYSSNTGLISDFVVSNPPRPANPYEPLEDEGENTGNYYYNSCRVPLRVVMDYCQYGNSDAKMIADKLASFAIRKSSGNPANIKTGYDLSGNPLSGSNYESTVFIAPLVAASMANPANQAFLTSGWNKIKMMRQDYFEDTYNMLAMLFISGNWYTPLN